MIDHRPHMFPAYDQTQAQSGCEANAVAQVFQYYRPAPAQNPPWYGWSRAGISAYRDNIIMRRRHADPVERTVEAANFFGLLTEQEWTTTENHGNNFPPLEVMGMGRRQLFGCAKLVMDFDQVRRGPLLLRMLTSRQFREPDRDGSIRPGPATEISRNPHQVVLAGQLDDGRFIILNSWGTNWGDHGCGYMTREQLAELAISLWLVYPNKR